MTILADHQFEILPSETATSGYVFGIGADVAVNGEDGFDPGETSWLSEDSDNTRRGVKGFGRDVQGAKTWLWNSHTDQADVASAVSALEDMEAAWEPDGADTPGWVTALRYQLAGRTRRVYGRPRRFAAPPTNLILSGMVPITHDFQCVDSYTYDDAESSAQIGYRSFTTGGGFAFPSVFPVVTQQAESNGSQQISVDGNAKAYPIIRFNGPWTNPSISTGAWTLTWKGGIGAGQWVEIDCRPWKLTVLNQSGASVVGGLGPRTFIEDCWFKPKSKTTLTLGGVASSGTTSATVRWRNTWKSL